MDKSIGAVTYRMQDENIEYLLVKSARADFWGLPKGHPEAGESEVETAEREIGEETCFDVKIIDGFREAIDYTLPSGEAKQVIFFLATLVRAKKMCKIDFNEITASVWAEYDSAMRLLTYCNCRNTLEKAHRFINQQMSMDTTQL